MEANPCSQAWPTRGKNAESVRTNQPPPHVLRLNFSSWCQTTKDRAPRSFLEIGQHWDDLEAVLPWRLLQCVGISCGAVSLLGVDLAKGKGKVKRLRRNISVWHINLGKYVYTLSLFFFFFWCFYFPTKWSLLSYSTVTSALREVLYYTRWEGQLWLKTVFPYLWVRH